MRKRTYDNTGRIARREYDRASFDPTTFREMIRVGKENGFRKLDIAIMLGVIPEYLSRWGRGAMIPHRYYQDQFPKLIERMKANPRINPNAVNGVVT